MQCMKYGITLAQNISRVIVGKRVENISLDSFTHCYNASVIRRDVCGVHLGYV